MRRAFSQVKNGRPGPVMVEVPADVVSTEVAVDPGEYRPVRATRSAGDERDVDEAATYAARRVLPDDPRRAGRLLRGGDRRAARSSPSCCRRPVMTTFDGKSAFPEDHALALGPGGGTFTGPGRHILHKSDLVLGDRLQLHPARHRDAGTAAGQEDHPRDQRYARPAQGLCRPTSASSATPSWCSAS